MVHGLVSSQLWGLPLQLPPEQTSLEVQALPSLQPSVELAKVQPPLGSQLSVVQGLPSLQARSLPGTHWPLAHRSPWVQTEPSSQGSVWLANWQPLALSQLSAVQGLPSLQRLGAPPWQTPPLHASLVVQAVASLHASAELTNAQPELGSQLSAVQGLPSLQVAGLAPVQLPPEQASPVVQALPSSQAKLARVNTQPLAGSQESVVQPLPSLQVLAVPGAQLPALQASPLLQTLPSSQGALLS